MPDHVHLLVTGLTDGADLRRFVKSAKQSSGQRYAKGEGERLWQESYYDHVVRPEESLFHLARYVIENPVKAGLVTDPRRYGHCGSDTWSLDELLSTTP